MIVRNSFFGSLSSRSANIVFDDDEDKTWAGNWGEDEPVWLSSFFSAWQHLVLRESIVSTLSKRIVWGGGVGWGGIFFSFETSPPKCSQNNMHKVHTEICSFSTRVVEVEFVFFHRIELRLGQSYLLAIWLPGAWRISCGEPIPILVFGLAC